MNCLTCQKEIKVEPDKPLPTRLVCPHCPSAALYAEVLKLIEAATVLRSEREAAKILMRSFLDEEAELRKDAERWQQALRFLKIARIKDSTLVACLHVPLDVRRDFTTVLILSPEEFTKYVDDSVRIYREGGHVPGAHEAASDSGKESGTG